MNFCPNCGTKILDDASFCTGCGAPVKKGEQNAQATNDQTTQSTQYTQTTQAGYQPQYTYSYAQPQKPVSKENSISSMIFGIISIFLSFFAMIPFACFVFLALSIVFIVLAKVRRNQYLREAGEDNGFSRTGKITSIVAIPVLSLFAFYGLFFTIGILSL